MLTARGRGVLNEFTTATHSENLPVETVLNMGIVASQICNRARSADTSVMIGHREVKPKISSSIPGSATENSDARNPPRQLFISPNKFREVEPSSYHRYDQGSGRASRAMQSAAEIANGLGVPNSPSSPARGIPSSASGRRPLRAATSRTTRPKAEFKLLQGHTNEEVVRVPA